MHVQGQRPSDVLVFMLYLNQPICNPLKDYFLLATEEAEDYLFVFEVH